MKLYHGSNIIIEEINLSMGRVGKDFGRGFYLSPDRSQAEKMAETTTFKLSSGTPSITAFEIEDSILASDLLKIKRFTGYTAEWAEFVALNRNNKTDSQLHDYDVVIGPIADDRVGVQMRLYSEQYIDAKELAARLQFVNPTIQYFFATPLSINYLRRL